MDQHAAHERVIFEKFMNQWKRQDFAIQNFLVPLEVILDRQQVKALENFKKDISSLGIEVQFQDSVVQVVAAPEFLTSQALSKGLEQMAIDILENEGVYALEQMAKDILATMSCHSSIRFGKSMGLDEMKALLKEMDVHKSSFCPHGRPVFVKYPFYQIDKDLSRIT